MLQISALHWNQDEDFGGFGGPHCTLPGGYGAVTDALGGLLPGLRLSTPVAKVEDIADGVRVTTASGANCSAYSTGSVGIAVLMLCKSSVRCTSGL